MGQHHGQIHTALKRKGQSIAICRGRAIRLRWLHRGTNLARRFPAKQQAAILAASLDQANLERMPVDDYLDLYVI